MPVGQRAAALAEGRAHDVDDDRLSHLCCLLEWLLRYSPTVSLVSARLPPRPTPDAAAFLAARHERLHGLAGARRVPLVGDACRGRARRPSWPARSTRLTCCSTTTSAVPLRLISSQPLVDRVDDDRSQAQGQLVGHEHLRRHHQHLGQREQALLAARQRARRSGGAARRGWGRPCRRARDSSELAPPVPLAEGQGEVLLHGEAREHAAPLDHVGHAQAGDLVGRAAAVTSCPEKMTWPDDAVTSPVTVRAMVDFPAPFEPTSATTPPVGHAERHVEERAVGPVGGADVAAPTGRRCRRCDALGDAVATVRHASPIWPR